MKNNILGNVAVTNYRVGAERVDQGSKNNQNEKQKW